MQLPQLVQAVILSICGGRIPRAVSRSATLKTSLGHRARQMPHPSAPLHSVSLIEMITGFSFAIASFSPVYLAADPQPSTALRRPRSAIGDR